MGAYIIRRLLYVIPIVIGVSLLLFLLFNYLGKDPALVMAGKHATPERIAEIRTELGLDRPILVQFGDYLRQVATFDFGRSFSNRQLISDIIWNGMWPSLSLALPAFSMTLMMSITIALMVAYFRGRALDRIIVILCVMGMSIPSLAFILFGQYFLAYKLPEYIGIELFPISGYDMSFPWPYVILPAIIWVSVSLGTDVRFFRTAILDETHQDYVRTARAKGLSEQVVFFKHVLKNSMIPILTYVVIQIPFLIMGTLLLENFFGIPGLGSILIDALNTEDLPVIKAVATISCLFLIAGTLMTDILYSVVDPRVSLK